MRKKRVLVLLSTYNGELYIRELLQSVESQEGVDLSIMVRDDGSTDNTLSLVRAFAKKYSNISITSGSNVGYAKSFWWLMQHASGYDYYAYCDQDDIWMPEKLQKATSMLNTKNPSLYTSTVRSVNNSGIILSENTFDVTGVQSVYLSFQRSFIPGCVMVFNENARKIMQQYNGFLESHDWATYTIIRTFGKVVFDNHSYINYRISGDNTIGVTSRANDLRKRILRFFTKSKCTRSRFAKDFCMAYGDAIPKQYHESILNLANYKENFRSRLKLVFDKNFKGFIFKIYVILGRV